MTEDQALWLTYGAMALVIVGSALAVRWRRRGHGPMLRMAAMWVVIFTVAVLLARFFGWQR